MFDNVHVGLLVTIALMTLWLTIHHYRADRSRVSYILHDVREGVVRGFLSGAIGGGDIVPALMGGAVFGTIGGFTKAVRLAI
jgi:hypothetical protein